MRWKRLAVRDFRNLTAVELRPSPFATVVVGRNGQGKTNLLEAVYLLCTLRPLRARRLAELIRFGASSAGVTGVFEISGADREISVTLAAGVRQALVDGKRVAQLEDYFGGVSVVAFTPDDLAVVKGAPDLRRAFLDRTVFNRFPAFLRESRDYGRALRARNRLLRAGRVTDVLEAYDESLARSGARLVVRRLATLAEVGPRAAAAFASIAQLAGARFGYLARKFPDGPPGDEDVLAVALLQALVERRPRDFERGFTSVGPHADDLDVQLDGRSARAFASQGQQRALVLAWKVAEIENLRAVLGRFPLLLLDDVSSELDPDRNAQLMRYLHESGAQVLLTTTDASLVERAAGPETSWLSVREGQLSAGSAR